MTISSQSWQQKDRDHIWHPFTQHKKAGPPLVIQKAKGSYLYTPEGDKILDAISSWWVTLHGHCHPKIVEAISQQVATLDQVIFADVTHPLAISLGERLTEILPKEISIIRERIKVRSVSSKNINVLKNIDLCDGFLIGGASLKHKNFIDIIKKYYN